MTKEFIMDDIIRIKKLNFKNFGRKKTVGLVEQTKYK